MALSSLPLQVLVASPRPTDRRSVPDHQAVEVLVTALEAQEKRAALEYLYPASWAALTQRFDQIDSPISVLCLDVEANREGEGWDLFFEDASAGMTIPAAELAQLLMAHNVGLAILGAVSSAGDDCGPALAEFVAAQSGVSIVALPRENRVCGLPALGALFAALSEGDTVGQATEKALRAGQDIEGLQLRPWDREETQGAGMPGPLQLFQVQDHVLYGYDSPEGDGQTVTPRERVSEPEPGAFPPLPREGCLGRERELARLEEALCGSSGNGITLVHGHEGVGKTTLVTHVARWLVQTGRFDTIVYTSFEGGGQLETAFLDLGVQLLSGAGSIEGTLQEAILAGLQRERTLVVWDHLEAIMPKGEFALSAERCEQLLKAGIELAQVGDSRLVVVSETPSIPNRAYDPHEVSLELGLAGLEERAGVALLQQLLAESDQPMPTRSEASQFVRLMGGHPMALALLTPVLAQRTLAEIVGDLKRIMPGFETGEARLRNGALDLALKVLLASLPETAVPGVLGLGLFVYGFMAPLVTTTGLYDRSQWAERAPWLIAAHAMHMTQLPGLNVPFVRLTPAFARGMARRLGDQYRVELEEKYAKAYTSLLIWMLKKNQKESQAIPHLGRYELPNLRRVLRLLMSGDDLNVVTDYSRQLQVLLTRYGFTAERGAIAEAVQRAASKAIPDEGPLGHSGVELLIRMFDETLAGGQLPQAAKLIASVCQRISAEEGLSYTGKVASLDRGACFLRLARVFLASGRIAEAVEHLNRVLGWLEPLAQDEEAAALLLGAYEGLGQAYMGGQAYQLARDAYGKGLSLAQRQGNDQSTGRMYRDLASATLAMGEQAEAKEHLHAAIASADKVDDGDVLMACWTQLGVLAQQAGDLDEATSDYQTALTCAERSKNLGAQAQAHTWLARVATLRQDLEAAEGSYEVAVRIYRQASTPHALVSVEMELARFLLSVGEHSKANVHAELARAAAEGLGAEASPWEIPALLEEIAEAEGDQARRAHWHSRAQESFAASPAAQVVLRQWHPIMVGVARACLGEALESRTVDLLEAMEADPEWETLAGAVWRVFGGERGDGLYTDLAYVQSVVVRRVLEMIENPEILAEATNVDDTETSGAPPAPKA